MIFKFFDLLVLFWNKKVTSCGATRTSCGITFSFISYFLFHALWRPGKSVFQIYRNASDIKGTYIQVGFDFWFLLSVCSTPVPRVKAYKKNLLHTGYFNTGWKNKSSQLFILYYYSYYLVRNGETLKDFTFSLSAVVIRLQYWHCSSLKLHSSRRCWDNCSLNTRTPQLGCMHWTLAYGHFASWSWNEEVKWLHLGHAGAPIAAFVLERKSGLFINAFCSKQILLSFEASVIAFMHIPRDNKNLRVVFAPLPLPMWVVSFRWNSTPELIITLRVSVKFSWRHTHCDLY